MDWDAETDVLVVGGGGGGLVAALAAAEEGAEVALVEKEGQLGGNTSLSSGSVPGAGTRMQRDAGIDDYPELFAADLIRRTGGTAPEHLVRVLTQESAPLVEWLIDHVGLQLELIPDLKKVGHSVPRIHAPPGRQGTSLVSGLEAAAADRGIMLSPGNPALRLLCDDNGNIAGAEVGQAARPDRIRARRVILASNGFGANPNLLRRYIPEMADAPYFGHQGNTGEGIEWGIQLGARVRNMQAFQGHASVSYPQGALMSWAAVERGGCLVNLAGERFVDETLGYSGCAAAVLAQPERLAFVVIDRTIREELAAKAQDFRDIIEYGGAPEAVDPAAAGASFGIDGDGLRRTLEHYAACASGEADCGFGRAQFGRAPLRSPFTVIRVTAGLFHTQGGLDVDGLARPLREDGSPIDGLYAVGGVAVGLSGAEGGRGYVSANGLLAALGLGRVAGRHAASSL